MFKVFLDAVTVGWLTKNSSYPLRALWTRGDILSSNEIFSLSAAIRKVATIDSLWLRNQLKFMKSAERNTYAGAFAEITTISVLNNANHITIPAKANQPGYDAVMSLVPSGKSIRFSIENYGQPKHEQTFVKWAVQTEELIVKLLKKYNYYPVTVWIDCATQYPSESKWKCYIPTLIIFLKEKKMLLTHSLLYAKMCPNEL